MKDIRKNIEIELKNMKLEFDNEMLSKPDAKNLKIEPIPINRDTQNNVIQPNTDNINRKDYDASVQCFMFNNFGLEIVVETLGKNVACISCLEMFPRIDLHLNKAKECAKTVEMDKFLSALKEHKKERAKIMNKLKCKEYADKKKIGGFRSMETN